MVSIRRWYIYLVSAITAQSVAWAFIALVRKLLLRDTADREVIALQIAVIVVTLPLFLLHWFWGHRLAKKEADEKRSFPRRLYLYGMLAAFLVPIIYNGNGLIRAVLNAIFGIEPTDSYRFTNRYSNGEMFLFGTTAVFVLALNWGYHRFVRWQDDKALRESDVSAVLRQLYGYSFMMIGLVMGAIGVGRILDRLLNPLFANEVMTVPLSTFMVAELTRAGVGLAVWLLFWWLGQRDFAGTDERERESVVRKAYLYLLVFIGAVGVIGTATFLLTDILERLVGVDSNRGGLNTAVAIIIVCGAIWAYHAFVLRRDAEVAGEVGKQALVRRIYIYLMTTLGLGAALIGLAGMVAVIFEALDDPSPRFDFWEQFPTGLAMFIVGLVVWLWHRRQASKKADPERPSGLVERRSFVRRLYLYFYIFVGTLAFLGSLIFLVSQVLMLLLGARTGEGLLLDLAQGIAYALIAVGVLLYHGRIIRQDSQLVETAELAQLKQLHVAVVDAGDGAVGQAIAERLREKTPGAIVHPVALTETAVSVMGVNGEGIAPEELLAEADVIVGPWSMAISTANGGIISPDVAGLIGLSQARKILLPEPGDGYSWVGVEPWRVEDIAKEVAEDVQALTLGETPSKRQGPALWAIVLIAIVSLCLLATIVPIVLSILLYNNV